MQDKKKTKEQLIHELKVLRQRVVELEAAEAQHKRTEEALRESESRFSTFMEYLPANITIKDHESKFVFGNKHMRDLFDIDNWVGKTAREYFPPEIAKRVLFTDRQILEQGPIVFEEAVPIKTGDVRILETRKFPIKQEGKPDLIGAISLDITERKRAEEALVEERNLLRTLIDNLPDYIYVKNIKSQFVLGNIAVARVMGATSPDELIGKNDFDFHPQELAAQYYANEQEVIQSGQPQFNREEPLIESSGNRTWILTTQIPLRDNQGKVVGLVGIGRDITKRKQAEEALRKAHDELEIRVNERTAELSKANAELARAARLKDEFLANMSHELRTPLHVILGMSESLQEEVYGRLNDKQLKSLHMIEESGRHLLALINDVLDLSKISTGQLELESTPVFVESVCQVSLRFIKQLAQKKRLKVSSMLDSDVTTIHADGRRLKQILVNLLSNAVKFTPEGGKIGLNVEGDAEQQVVHFTVWDTGIGIAQEDMARLFQPFVQLDASLSRKYEGTGLGLSLVYRMVEMHGGSVSVESEVGQGSRFTVSLPWQELGNEKMGRWGDGEIGSLGDEESKDIASDLSTSRSSHLPLSSPSQAQTILVAEDHEATINTLSRFFAAKGYRVFIARNGRDAFVHTRETHPDLIVMDIQMPEMDGLEAIRRIRSDQYGQSIPIIALTALAMPGDREQCLAAGANEYLSKPVSLRRLSEAIERFLSST